jgi:hypothetical protein
VVQLLRNPFIQSSHQVEVGPAMDRVVVTAVGAAGVDVVGLLLVLLAVEFGVAVGIVKAVVVVV